MAIYGHDVEQHATSSSAAVTASVIHLPSEEEEKRIIASNLEIAIPRDHTDSWYQGSPGQGLAQNLHSVQSNCGEAMSLLTSVTPRGSDFTLN